MFKPENKQLDIETVRHEKGLQVSGLLNLHWPEPSVLLIFNIYF
jgi:hypothetical protein